MTFKQELQEFIRKTLSQSMGSEIGENDPLIESGMIDSMGLLQIITFIEERTRIRVPDSEVTPDNFNSVADISKLVDRLKSA